MQGKKTRNNEMNNPKSNPNSCKRKEIPLNKYQGKSPSKLKLSTSPFSFHP